MLFWSEKRAEVAGGVMVGASGLVFFSFGFLSRRGGCYNG